MNVRPRLALATPAAGPEPSVAGLAMMAGLKADRWRVQHFRARACPLGNDAARRASGMPGRHLDAWLMPPDVCRAVFERGAFRADLAIVEGTLESHIPEFDCQTADRPGLLAPIVEALQLPKVVVVPCRALEDFHLPRMVGGADALLLDGLRDPGEFEAIRRMAVSVFRLPVLGAVEALPEARAALESASQDQPSDGVLERLGQSFLRFADLPAIRALAASRPLPTPPAEALPPSRPRAERRFRVAYAQDDAFGGYFPDTLETLEALGAELVEFSPLGDGELPEGIDLVILGCGFPDHHADQLAANVSLIAALRSHVCQGHRIYAEGGGTAYLGRSMILGDRVIPGAGILPFHATLVSHPPDCRPVVRTLSRDSWLGRAGTIVRGYRSGRWTLRPVAEASTPAGSLTAQGDVYCRHHAVGGLMHLHLAALPQVVAAFAGPHPASLTLPLSRG